MNLEEYKGVYVFAQQVDNEVSSIALELIGKGKDLAKDLNTEVTAVLVGSGVKELADQLAEYGADRVIVVDDPELKEYRTEPYTHALASVVEKYKPEIFLIGATAIGRDLGPRVCARIHTGLTADCTTLDPLTRMLKANEINSDTYGFSWASHAIMMPVKPTPPATPILSVISEPVACTMPATPAIPPERNMVRSTTRRTLMPA